MKKDSPRTPSDEAGVYIRAAKAIEEHECSIRGCHSSCCALARAGATYPQTQAFAALFKPEQPDNPLCAAHWWDATEEMEGPRILALCFMAAITERP